MNLKVMDRKGIVVGTWTRGETFTALPNDVIEVNGMGVAKFKGKILNLPAEMRSKLLASKRLVEVAS